MTDEEKKALADRVRAAARELEAAANAADTAGLSVEIEIHLVTLMALFHGRTGTQFSVSTTVTQEI